MKRNETRCYQLFNGGNRITTERLIVQLIP